MALEMAFNRFGFSRTGGCYRRPGSGLGPPRASAAGAFRPLLRLRLRLLRRLRRLWWLLRLRSFRRRLPLRPPRLTSARQTAGGYDLFSEETGFGPLEVPAGGSPGSFRRRRLPLCLFLPAPAPGRTLGGHDFLSEGPGFRPSGTPAGGVSRSFRRRRRSLRPPGGGPRFFRGLRRLGSACGFVPGAPGAFLGCAHILLLFTAPIEGQCPAWPPGSGSEIPPGSAPDGCRSGSDPGWHPGRTTFLSCV